MNSSNQSLCQVIQHFWWVTPPQIHPFLVIVVVVVVGGGGEEVVCFGRVNPIGIFCDLFGKILVVIGVDVYFVFKTYI